MQSFNKEQRDRISQLIELGIQQFKIRDRNVLSFEEIKLLSQLIEEEANLIGIPIVFCLLDPSGLQKYYFAMPNALLISHKLAYKKAYSAVAMRMSTDELAKKTGSDMPLHGLRDLTELCTVGGGFPCWHQGKIIASIGVSGGTVEQDMTIVINALRRFSEQRFLLSTSAR